MVSFIDEHREVYGVEPICEVLPIAPSTYYVHAARGRDPAQLPERALRDAELTPQIKRAPTVRIVVPSANVRVQ